MPNQILTPSDILQRRLDILGRAQNVSVSSAQFNQVSLIFNTGDIAYPSGANRIYVAYVIVEFSAGAPANNTFVYLGTAGTFDWMGYGFPLDVATVGFSPPYVLSPTMNIYGLYNPPVYAKGLAFTVTNKSAATNATLATFTAVGWAE